MRGLVGTCGWEGQSTAAWLVCRRLRMRMVLYLSSYLSLAECFVPAQMRACLRCELAASIPGRARGRWWNRISGCLGGKCQRARERERAATRKGGRRHCTRHGTMSMHGWTSQTAHGEGAGLKRRGRRPRTVHSRQPRCLCCRCRRRCCGRSVSASKGRGGEWARVPCRVVYAHGKTRCRLRA
ncbi:hypothetical protein C8R47DRAFT_1120175 [Mycena vitilis]|nr:hypothetical protein C8R47DRAFT_1120175 [Mycena vitilis]